MDVDTEKKKKLQHNAMAILFRKKKEKWQWKSAIQKYNRDDGDKVNWMDMHCGWKHRVRNMCTRQKSKWMTAAWETEINRKDLHVNLVILHKSHKIIHVLWPIYPTPSTRGYKKCIIVYMSFVNIKHGILW